MNYEITKELLAEQQTRFKDVDNQLALLNTTIQELENEQADVKGKSFFVGKVKKLSEITGELEEANKEKASLLEQRKALLLNNNDVNGWVESMAVTGEAIFTKEVLSEVEKHVAAINEFIKKGSDLDSQFSQEIRSDISTLIPYVDDNAKKQLNAAITYKRFNNGIPHAIHQIDDLALHGWS
ncbi:hypothetical protein SAMN04487821_11049 [Enterococcus malodoratus]|uniref:hypothetical protein n=1 Tax=Enterococcus malodoratus TaxID=71451 RepID=UPI0008C6B2BE|nr:hypothetical protein [Enterococcus malodoratus]SET33988.1 hypothetical protein SAMN04487821_11049 [Enterococcus malodoratus]